MTLTSGMNWPDIEIPEPTGEDFGKPGWTYKDLPRMTPEIMKSFKELIGIENAHWLTFADYGTSVRGQLLISPQGIQNITNHLTKNVDISEGPSKAVEH